MEHPAGESGDGALRVDFDAAFGWNFMAAGSRPTPACSPTENWTMHSG
jgi:hypothetical protein